MDKRQLYDRLAPLYDLLDLPFEYIRYRPIRPVMFEGISGAILDAGVGTGRNMPFYPDGGQMTGIDLSSSMIVRAGRRRNTLDRHVELLEMSVLDTSFPDAHFDAVIATFLFCVLDDEHQLSALRELARICKPGGEVRILEYSLSDNPLRRRIMKLWAPWVRGTYGASFDRNTEQYIEESGLELVETRFVYKDTIKLIVMRPVAAVIT